MIKEKNTTTKIPAEIDTKKCNSENDVVGSILNNTRFIVIKRPSCYKFGTLFKANLDYRFL